MDKPVTDQIVFAEVWKHRTRAAVVSLEEYVVKHWHHGRIVLAGDAVHKHHLNMALGGNSAIEGVASQLNNIHRLLQTNWNLKPSATAPNTAPAAYQEEGERRMQELKDLSNLVAKMQVYATSHGILADWALPLQDDRRFAERVGRYIAASPKLDFLAVDGFTTGNMEWKSEKRMEEKTCDEDLGDQFAKAVVLA